MRAKALLHAPVILLAAVIAGCGSVAPAHTPSILVVKEESAGQTVQAQVGDTVRVELVESFPVPGSSLVWDVTTSAPGVLKPDKVTRDPAQRPRQGTVRYSADFIVMAAGEAKLFARGSQTCEAMPVCPQKDFTVTVVAT